MNVLFERVRVQVLFYQLLFKKKKKKGVETFQRLTLYLLDILYMQKVKLYRVCSKLNGNKNMCQKILKLYFNLVSVTTVL